MDMEKDVLVKESSESLSTNSNAFYAESTKHRQLENDEDAALAQANQNNLPKSKSTSSLVTLSDEALYLTFTQLDQRNKTLARELSALKHRLEGLEKDMGKSKWGLRYSRRMAVIANLLVGIWIFWRRLLWYAFKKKKDKKARLSMVVRKPETFLQTYLKEAYIYAIGQAWIFFMTTLLLLSKDEWKRQAGLVISSGASIFMAYKSQFLGSNYFNLVANLLYATTDWSTSPSWSKTRSLDYYIGTKTEKIRRVPSQWANNSEDNMALAYLYSHFKKRKTNKKTVRIINDA